MRYVAINVGNEVPAYARDKIVAQMLTSAMSLLLKDNHIPVRVSWTEEKRHVDREGSVPAHFTVYGEALQMQVRWPMESYGMKVEEEPAPGGERE